MKFLNKSGITLIGLVITIIVLIILTLTTFSILQKNAIIDYALNASEEVKRNGAKEKIKLEVVGSRISNGKYVAEEIKNDILSHIDNSTVTGITFPLIATVDGYTFKIDDTGKVVEAECDYQVEFNGNGVVGAMKVQDFWFGESKKLHANQYAQEGYSFLNWNTEADGSGKDFYDEELVSDLTSEAYGVVTLYAQWSKGTAQVNGVDYDGVQDALDKIPTNGIETKIRIAKDTTENITIKAGQNVVFDLRDKTLNSEQNAAVITNNGQLTITNGTVSSTFATGTINNNKGATLIIDGGIITGKERSAIYNDRGTVIIKGDAYITSTATGFASNQVLERGAVHNLSGGTVYIKGGTIIGITQQAVTNMGKMIIGDEGDIDTTSPVIIGNTYGIKSNGTLEIYDGIVKGKEGTISGTITKREPNTKRTTGTEEINGETYQIEYLETVQ